MPNLWSAIRRFGKEKRDDQWHRTAVGGMWDEIGRLQFAFLVDQGLKPGDYFLDVDCGSLRGGIHFIRYLERGRYYGIDANAALLGGGRTELEKEGLADKAPVLLRMEDFSFATLHRQFNFALAQSVFTHLPLNHIIRCVVNMETALVQGGQFFATFFENAGGKFNLDPIMHERTDGEPIASHFDRDPYHYSFDTFQWVCEGTSLRVQYLGDWSYPRDQKIIMFTKF